MTEGLEQGHEANLTASWGGEDKKARYYFGFLRAATVEAPKSQQPGCRSVCQSLEVRQVQAAPPFARGRAPNFHLSVGFPDLGKILG